MKYFLKIIFVFFLPLSLNAQQGNLSNLHAMLENATNDSIRYYANFMKGYYYQELNRDSALYFLENALLIARNNNKKFAEASALALKGYQMSKKGRFAESLQIFLQAFTIVESTKSENNNWSRLTTQNLKIYTLSRIQLLYSMLMHVTQNTEQEIFYLKESKKNGHLLNDSNRIAFAGTNLGAAYIQLHKPDSALIFLNEALPLLQQAADKKYTGEVLTLMGMAFLQKDDKPQALKYYHAGVQASLVYNNLDNLARSCFTLTEYYLEEQGKDSALYYAKKTLEARLLIAADPKDITIDEIYENLFLAYRMRNQTDSAFKYLELALTAKQNVNETRINDLAEFQNLQFSEQLRLRKLEEERISLRNRIRTYVMLAGIGIFMVIAFLLYRINRNRKKANKILLNQKAEIEKQKRKAESALDNLKATQAQLIQSEKMASLGEMTAGIAHEIQNPLNFVNNFSEVSNELVDEMNTEIDKGDLREVKIIAADIKQNLEKINHHGKRADAIVKGMLQHSRSSSGVKELVDINVLADEYLRLAYHGLRAKDKSFNAKFETNLDTSIEKISVVPQEIGRVILNLINNAFYAVSERKKLNEPGYEPTVSVSTFKDGDTIRIRVSDNGTGIPHKVLDKIFQPFFTTKPTGQGTGLGLSLSYDIIKAHGGELKVETKEGEGSTFIILLPIG
jgi:signal transduction histidine kinase/predicted negative regulator of RcsB-dependent stress response